MTERVRLAPKGQLLARNLRPKKSFGQNFLGDVGILERIAAEVTAVAPASRRGVEYGSGTGALTAPLLDAGMQLHAVERDRDLVPVLRDRFADDIERGTLVLHEANASTFVAPFDEPYVLCGNLPYHLTSGLLSDAVDNAQVCAAVFLIQKEVADRVAAPEGNKTYGTLSVIVQRVFDAHTAFIVPKGAFWPVPDVDGGVLVLKRRATPRGGDIADADVRRVVKAAFGGRRKTLRNALKKLLDPDAFDRAGVDPSARADTLTVEQFVALARELPAPPEAGAAETDGA